MLLYHRYKIIRDLAEGSFGKTFLAEDTQMPTRQQCVIKQLKPINDDRPGVVQLVEERFAREAAVLEAIGHGHSQIPDLLAYFELDGQFYLVQEWIEGTPLSELLQTPWPEEKVSALLASALDALAHVHAQNIIHRDIKPDNIILRQSDQLPCLIDFGAVKELMNTVVVPSASQASSVVIGTLGFMAPEQAVGRPVFSSDLYSLGMTAIYLLTGHSPLEIPTDSMNGRLLWNQFAPDTNPRLTGILTRAIHPYPPTRFASATDMLAVLTGQPAPSNPPATVVSPAISQTPTPPQISTPQTPIATTPSAQTFPVASTEVFIPQSATSHPAASQSTTQITSSATKIGHSAAQRASTATQITPAAQPAPANSQSAPANKYYSLAPSAEQQKTQKKKNLSLFLKAGGAAVGVLFLGVASLFGAQALSTFSANGEIDASTPEKLDRAIAKLEKKVNARANDTEALLSLIEGYVNRGSYEDALSQINTLTQSATDDRTTMTQALYWKGKVQVLQGQYAEAIETLAEAVKQDSKNAAAINLLGGAYQRTGQYDSALARYQAAVTADATYGSGYVNQAAISEIRGNYSSADALLAEALTEIDDDEEIEFYTFRGNFYAGTDEIEKAEADWTTVSNLTPRDADDYALQGFSQGILGDIDNAMGNFDQALAINPNLADTYVLRGIIHARQGDNNAASADVDSALAINPNAVGAYQLLSTVEIAGGDADDVTAAIDAATQGLKVNPNHPNLLSERCGGHYLSGQFEPAIADCTKSIEINAQPIEPYTVRGQAYFGQQDYESAEKDFTHVIEYNETNGKQQTALVYGARAVSRAELNDNAGAQADLTEAIALEPNEPDYYKLRGMLRFIAEDTTAAGEDLRKAEELYKAQGEEDEKLNTVIGLLEQLGVL